MKRSFRLTRTTDFERVRTSGKAYAHPLVVMLVCENNANRLRIGIAAGKSVGKAVERNRAKRRLRACVTNRLQDLQPGWDLVFLARAAIMRSNYAQLQAAVDNLLQRAGLVALSVEE